MTIRRILLAAALATLATSAGCLPSGGFGSYSPGGSGFSLDAGCYVSTEYQPQTFTLVDVRTGQAIWSYDIPVGKELVFRFYEQSAEGNYLYPDLMKWDIWPAGQTSGEPSQKFLVPSATARKIDLRLRPVPEFATPDVK